MWSDARTKVHEMRTAVAAFVDERDWGRYHTPVNVASAALVEAGELLEHFQWRREGDPLPGDVARSSTEELADVLNYALALANAAGQDLPIDGMTIGELLEGEEPDNAGPKALAEEVAANAALALVAVRAVEGDTGAALDLPDDEGPPVAVCIEILVASLARCASALGADLSRELELKMERNRARFPVGTRPDVGY
jgi:NTP pyrophosphatase (non-canonical NTP hydrolase)